ncbi:uncharacterized protein LACBIDRAFT_324468 [Laccaria bicolor S238N-H82]|uniref:Predicted protein n=1 Tax=Laccaria bicolor (strain S238N-H82 / ATCC MYA-4686) TaxID=486041 RepID=B0D1X2_LACBS|nr:uncharacterized protein LACBIDRAFT_324468 [Laccaria bicolor S238N-H82]EDR12066.1 predicted protein [Laccaria bicolor S238N-H82]|eukprot:XP_001877963.1 predicted protein [Laccaria bicolor S238N-H82]
MKTGSLIWKVLKLLAIAANVAQSSHTHLNHVLLTLGNLIRIFSKPTEAFDEDLWNRIIKSIEKRWKKADQDIFIVVVFLNPFIRDTLFNKEFLMEVQLYNIMERTYERILQCESNLDFLEAFKDYRWLRGEFSDDDMSLSLMKEKFTHEGAPLDLQNIWAQIDKGVNCGQNGLVKLAVHIFSVIANSAGCEHVFSKFGITHTKLHDKLDPERVHKLAVIGMEDSSKIPTGFQDSSRIPTGFQQFFQKRQFPPIGLLLDSYWTPTDSYWTPIGLQLTPTGLQLDSN